MTAWLAASVIAAGLVALSYAGALRDNGRAWLPAALRALGAVLLAAALLDAPAGRAAPAAPLVVLDASASWTRATDDGALAAARDSADRAAGTDRPLLAGDSLRAGAGAGAGRDAASRAGDAVERAAAAGRPLVFVTDGEPDEADALVRAPRGSRTVVVRPSRGVDAAVLAAEAPRAAAARDTVEIRATVGADAAGAGVGDVVATVRGRVLVTAALPALGPFGRHEVRLRVPLAGTASGAAALTVAVRSAGDREPRNDTLALALDVTDAPAAVFASGAPDYDARMLVAILRGALALPVRAYVRVAPGQWRVEGTLAPVAESEVRAAAARASLLVLHGDTAALGAPRALGRGALALVAPPLTPDTSVEWYATSAPASPVAGALADVAWDSLPPLDVGSPAAGEWQALVARGDRRGPPRSIIAGSDAARRTVVATAGGFWRWQFRGGRAGDAAVALWGGLFDWLAAGRGDERPVLPEAAAVREGDPVRWRRGGADSAVRVVLTRSGATRADTLVIRFPAGARVGESPPVAAGVYEARTAGGSAVLAVNASRELLPRRPTVASGRTGSGAAGVGTAPGVRDSGWPYAAAALLFCAEWVLRRRLGLR